MPLLPLAVPAIASGLSFAARVAPSLGRGALWAGGKLARGFGFAARKAPLTTAGLSTDFALNNGDITKGIASAATTALAALTATTAAISSMPTWATIAAGAAIVAGAMWMMSGDNNMQAQPARANVQHNGV